MADFLVAADALQLTGSEQEQLIDLQRDLEVVMIARALSGLFPDGRAAAWLRAPNQAFNDRPAIDLLLSPDADEVARLRSQVEYWAYNGW